MLQWSEVSDFMYELDGSNMCYTWPFDTPSTIVHSRAYKDEEFEMQFNFNWRCKWPPFGISYIVNASIMKIYAKIYLLNGFSNVRLFFALSHSLATYIPIWIETVNLQHWKYLGDFYVKFTSKYGLKIESYACSVEILEMIIGWKKYEKKINLQSYGYDHFTSLVFIPDGVSWRWWSGTFPLHIWINMFHLMHVKNFLAISSNI